MPGNIELTDTGIVALETILNAYLRHAPASDRDLVGRLASRTGDVMTKAHAGGDPTASQTHLFYTETAAEETVLRDALDWAIDNGRRAALARQIKANV